MMSKNLSAVLLTFPLAFTFYSANCQTAEEIIMHSVNAVGGKALLNNIHSIIYEGVSSVMGNDLPTTLTVVQGKGFKAISTFNGMDIISCFTDKTGWMINPAQGLSTALPLPGDAVKAAQQSLTIVPLLYIYQNLGYTAALTGNENINGINAWKIKLGKEYFNITYFIDPSSWYVLRTETHAITNGTDVTSIVTFSNYKKTDIGYIIPYTTESSNMGYDVTVNYTRITFNPVVDLSIFNMPQ